MLQCRIRMMNDRALLSRSAGQFKHIVMICGRDQMQKMLRMAYLCFILAIVVIIASSIWGYKSGKISKRQNGTGPLQYAGRTGTEIEKPKDEGR